MHGSRRFVGWTNAGLDRTFTLDRARPERRARECRTSHDLGGRSRRTGEGRGLISNTEHRHHCQPGNHYFVRRRVKWSERCRADDIHRQPFESRVPAVPALLNNLAIRQPVRRDRVNSRGGVQLLLGLRRCRRGPQQRSHPLAPQWNHLRYRQSVRDAGRDRTQK
jgi:hypothetical protein